MFIYHSFCIRSFVHRHGACFHILVILTPVLSTGSATASSKSQFTFLVFLQTAGCSCLPELEVAQSVLSLIFSDPLSTAVYSEGVIIIKCKCF